MPMKPKPPKGTAGRAGPIKLVPKSEPCVTKQTQAIGLMRRPEGATVKDLVDATGWQTDTVRAMVCAIRKGRDGNTPISVETMIRKDRRTVYRIVGPAG